MYYYLNYFFIFSILGHFIEGFFYTSTESGILYGYWTPVYGLGVVSILVLYNAFYENLENSKIKKILYTFIIGGIVLSILEYFGGVIIEILFHKIFWSYSNMKYNIGKYTSLEMALIWGMASLLIVYIIKPFMDKYITKIPKIITWVLSIIMIIDIILTSLKI